MNRPTYPPPRVRVAAADDHQWGRGFAMGVVAGVCVTLCIMIVAGVLL